MENFRQASCSNMFQPAQQNTFPSSMRRQFQVSHSTMNAPMAFIEPDVTKPYRDMYAGVDELPLAMAYVPCQKFQKIYELDKAMEAGTIFYELHQPFCGKRGVCDELL